MYLATDSEPVLCLGSRLNGGDDGVSLPQRVLRTGGPRDPLAARRRTVHVIGVSTQPGQRVRDRERDQFSRPCERPPISAVVHPLRELCASAVYHRPYTAIRHGRGEIVDEPLRHAARELCEDLLCILQSSA